MVGQSIGTWILGEELGRGPVGVVYSARSSEDPLRVAAIKILIQPGFSSPEFLGRFSAEMLSLHRLTHPNIARFYDSGVHAGQPWYAAERVEGQDLGTAIRERAKQGRSGGFRWATELLPIAVQLARALKHGHLRSVLHRSLKPSNVMLTPSGQVKLLDFGVAKFLGLVPMNLSPDPWGTLGYLAPEVFQGKPFTRKSDIYALGGLLYTLLAGRPPFPGTTVAEFLHKHCYTLPERPAHFAADLPADLDELLCGLLAKDPSRRPTSAVALIPALEQIRGKAERKGMQIPWPDDTGGTSEVMPALTPEQIEEATEARPRPLLSRPLVVLPLFLLVVGLLLTLTFWPRATADELIQQARPLLESDDPAQWDRAWEEYLIPLKDRFPDAYTTEIEAARQKIRDRRDLRKALDEAGRVRYRSEAERLYHRGLRLCQNGEPQAACQLWRQIQVAFAEIESERHWVELAAVAIRQAELRPNAVTTSDRAALLTALERIEQLKRSGDEEAAQAVLEALRQLYSNDPAAMELLPKP